METKPKIPQHILEEINLGEIPAQNYYAKYGKENLEEELEKLQISNMEFYNNIPERNSKKYRHYLIERVLSIAVCAASFFFAGFRYYSNRTAINSAIVERVKGGNAKELFVYRQNGQTAELLQNKAQVSTGDTLQLAFNANRYGYILIFSVDGNGNVTSHYPSESLDAVKLPSSGGTTYLDYSYELDDAPDFELFIMVTSDYPFSITQEELEGLSLRKLQKGKYLPADSIFTTFLVTK